MHRCGSICPTMAEIIKIVASLAKLICRNKQFLEKKYAYDFSYWSHDGFTEEANGYNRPDGNKYIDQVTFNLFEKH